MRYPTLLILGLIAFWMGCQNAPLSPSEIRHHEDIPTRDSLARKADVYLPPGYHSQEGKKFPVIYMFDGENLFFPDSAKMRLAWQIDTLLDQLITAGEMEPCIVVGVWSTYRRPVEYLPNKGFEHFPDSVRERFMRTYKEPESDHLLEILVNDIKPFIDSEYRTLPDARRTFVGGAASGALVALYAVSEYPGIFGGAACLSTHWPISPRDMFPDAARAMIDIMGKNLPDPANHKIYFDYGTQGYDVFYEPYQTQMDAHMQARGYKRGKNWLTEKFPEHGSTPLDWGRRFPDALRFLLSS
jgi:predicted esterase